jgi:hypothetical protein
MRTRSQSSITPSNMQNFFITKDETIAADSLLQLGRRNRVSTEQSLVQEIPVRTHRMSTRSMAVGSVQPLDGEYSEMTRSTRSVDRMNTRSRL